MRVVVLGAQGGVGSRAVGTALERGYEVVAAARSAPEPPGGTGAGTAATGRVTPVALDVRDAGAVQRAVEGADAVLWCVGVTKRSGGDVGRAGMPHVVRAMQQSGVPRLVSVSGAGITLAGDRKGAGARLVSALARRLGGDLVLDKAGEHAVLADSDLSWTEVRPPRLRDADATGAWALTDRAPGITARPVAKGDVAAAMLDLAASRDWERRSPFLVAG